jgi:hypothetical protein
MACHLIKLPALLIKSPLTCQLRAFEEGGGGVMGDTVKICDHGRIITLHQIKAMERATLYKIFWSEEEKRQVIKVFSIEDDLFVLSFSISTTIDEIFCSNSVRATTVFLGVFELVEIVFQLLQIVGNVDTQVHVVLFYKYKLNQN